MCSQRMLKSKQFPSELQSRCEFEVGGRTDHRIVYEGFTLLKHVNYIHNYNTYPDGHVICRRMSFSLHTVVCGKKLPKTFYFTL
jgi:hypothetical protein